MAFSADNALEIQKKSVVEGLCDLVRNNKIDQNSDDIKVRWGGNNLEAIKKYIETYKSEIDFTCAIKTPNKVGGNAYFTVLQAACAEQWCSYEVVQLLCKAGAPVNEEKKVYCGEMYPVTHCLKNVAITYDMSDGAYPMLYENAINKLEILKKHAAGTKLFVENPSDIKKLLRNSIKEDGGKDIVYTRLIAGTVLQD
jgi:hypothetical protein